MALALGFDGSPLALAQLCQRAEQRASGVPCGIMDQLASAAGVAGHALRIDCTTPRGAAGADARRRRGGRRRLRPAPGAGDQRLRRAGGGVPGGAGGGRARSATRRWPTSTRIGDEVVRRRARHVVTENARVDAAGRRALGAGDRAGDGRRDGGQPPQPARRLRGEHPGARRAGRRADRGRRRDRRPRSPAPASAAASSRWSSAARALPMPAWRVRRVGRRQPRGGRRPAARRFCRMEIERLGPDDVERVVAASVPVRRPRHARVDGDVPHRAGPPPAVRGDRRRRRRLRVRRGDGPPGQGHRDVPLRARRRRRRPGQGVGKALVAALRDLAVERGCYGMWVLTDHDNDAALATYRGAGASDPDPQVLLDWTFDRLAAARSAAVRARPLESSRPRPAPAPRGTRVRIRSGSMVRRPAELGVERRRAARPADGVRSRSSWSRASLRLSTPSVPSSLAYSSMPARGGSVDRHVVHRARGAAPLSSLVSSPASRCSGGPRCQPRARSRLRAAAVSSRRSPVAVRCDVDDGATPSPARRRCYGVSPIPRPASSTAAGEADRAVPRRTPRAAAGRLPRRRVVVVRSHPAARPTAARGRRRPTGHGSRWRPCTPRSVPAAALTSCRGAAASWRRTRPG